MTMVHRFVKRAVDVLVAASVLIATAPLMLVVSLLIRFRLGSPVVFSQPRPGLRARTFNIYKFRTMTDERDALGELLPDEQRLTRFGIALRKTSLDELPQLFNVLKGDLTLVGPRPLLVEYLRYYSAEEMRRHDVKPGITGWAQVNGRNAISWEQKFAYDLWYVDHASILLDLRILWMTLQRVLKSEGVSPRDQLIMERFRGTPKGESSHDS